jgi:nucleoside 2-deoxyribosyltransferase
LKIYLAGPIDDCNHDEIHGWRDYVKENFTQNEYIDPSTSPFTGKANCGDEIVAWDKNSIRDVDLVLVNYWKLGTGTAMEIMYCHTLGTPCIVVAPGKVSPWISYHATEVVHDIDDAMLAVQAHDHFKGEIPENAGDPVNHPDHYTHGGIEVIDFLKAKGLDRDFCLGNVVKYVARANFKGRTLEDLRKAQWYLKTKIGWVEEQETNAVRRD